MKLRDEHPSEFLMRWYLAQCNGEWEHQHGVRIETLDNPGWALDIDLVDTPFAGRTYQRSFTERSEEDWIAVEASGGVFRGRGGASNLIELMQAFRLFIGSF